MNASLFELGSPAPLSKDILGSGTAFLAGFTIDTQDELLLSLKCIAERSPFRNMGVPSENGPYRTLGLSRCRNPSIERWDGNAEIAGHIASRLAAGKEFLGLLDL